MPRPILRAHVAKGDPLTEYGMLGGLIDLVALTSVLALGGSVQNTYCVDVAKNPGNGGGSGDGGEGGGGEPLWSTCPP